MKHVNAEKRFSIHEAPLVLTVHLKRFSPLGRKLSHPLQYDDELSLQPYMSQGRFGPTYSLYGVICHAGSGPNSGHYFAHVKSREGRWFEMNDESVSQSGIPTDIRNAYMLFYIQNKGQSLEAAVKAPLLNSSQMKNGLAAGMKKKIQKSRFDDEEDKGVKVSAPVLGPLLPSPAIASNSKLTVNGSPSPVDPQALSLKSKIEGLVKSKPSKALENLGDYASDDDDDEPSAPHGNPDKMEVDSKGKEKEDDLASNEIPTPDSTSSAPPSSPIPASSFYGNSNSKKNKKRKFAESNSDNTTFGNKSTPIQARTKGYVTSNPYNFQPKSAKRKRMGI